MKGSRFLEKVNDPGQNWVMYFLVGVLGLGVLGNGVANLLLEDLAGWLAEALNFPKVLIQLAMLIAIALLIFYGIYRTSRNERLQELLSARVQSQTNVVPLIGTYCGLITIASKPTPDRKTPAEEAIHFHWQQGNGNLRYCWVICTQDVLAANLERLRAIAATSVQSPTPITLLENPDTPLQPLQAVGRIVQIQIMVIDWPSAQDPNFVKHLVDRIYLQARSLSIAPQAVIADYTGGIKSTSAGVILACSTPERSLQYTSARYYDDAGNPQGVEVMQVKLSYRLKLAQD
ncbi:MAG: hypothetical protein DCF15_05315 [Phormidesmis priestleyi]|uniref:CRISPR-associated protein n=1 Tax=Phormidesmis priestleyi TaxID=268141 RepID=A0A2W4XMD9_9CYAN|nr:MAG: hypothetical protein DCF15_05315 [Phormidesmis priestleyi]